MRCYYFLMVEPTGRVGILKQLLDGGVASPPVKGHTRMGERLSSSAPGLMHGGQAIHPGSNASDGESRGEEFPAHLGGEGWDCGQELDVDPRLDERTRGAPRCFMRP